MFHAYTDAPLFADDAPIASADVQTLADNALILDRVARRGRRAFQSSAIPQRLNAWPRVNPLRVWWGSYQHRTGLNQLSVTIDYTTHGGTQTLQLLINGAVVQQQAISGTSAVTWTYSLTSHINLYIYEIEVRVVFSVTPDTEGGSYIVRDATVSGYNAACVALAGNWPGLPAIAGNTITVSQLNQIANAQDWLAQRMDVMPLPLFQCLRFLPTMNTPRTVFLWLGSVQYVNGAGQLVVECSILDSQNQAERVRVRIGGSEVATTPTFGVGHYAKYTLTADISGYAVGTRLDVTIESIITTGNPTTNSEARFTRFVLKDVYTRAASAAVVTPPAIPLPGALLTFADLKAKLTIIVNQLAAIKSRIDNAGNVWEFSRPYRRRYVFNDGMDAGYTQLQTAIKKERLGNTLWIRGQGVGLGYAGLALKDRPHTVAWTYEPVAKADLTPADRMESKPVALDGISGLFHGSEYWLTGKDVIYAAEGLF